MLRNHGYIAHVLMMLYSLVVAAEYASARCECVLSSLPFFLSKARVDAPQRRGKTTEWETDFTHLSFERKMLMQHQLTNY